MNDAEYTFEEREYGTFITADLPTSSQRRASVQSDTRQDQPSASFRGQNHANPLFKPIKFTGTHGSMFHIPIENLYSRPKDWLKAHPLPAHDHIKFNIRLAPHTQLYKNEFQDYQQSDKSKMNKKYL